MKVTRHLFPLSVLFAAISLSLVLISCGKSAGTTSFKYENTPENLQKLFEFIQLSAYSFKEPARAAALFNALYPDETRLKKGLIDGVDPAIVAKILEMYKGYGMMSAASANKIMKETQGEVQAHAATTEEIAKYESGSVAFNEFPGGAKQAAGKILRPGMTFYEVEYLEPGNDKGMKYHLIFWDGSQWAMMGPVWRALPK